MKLKEKQKNIFNVAIELFKEKGYVGSSMRDLASKLSIKAASLYAHIRSKEEILEWICFGMATDFFIALQKVKKTKISGKEKLDFFINNHLSVVLKNPDVTHIYSNEWRHLDGRLPEFLELRKKYQMEVENLISEVFIEQKWELKSPKFTTKFVLYTLNNSHLWSMTDQTSIPEITSQIREKLLFGLIGK